MKWISNKTLFSIHGWLGLNLGLLLFVICFSGTFATLSSEVDWLLNPDIRVEEQDAPVQWQGIYKSLKQEFPDGRILGIYKNSYAGHGDHFASLAYVRLPSDQTRKVYLNPYSGEIQANTSFFNVQRFFRSYHRRFFDGTRGILVVTLSSFFLLFSALTGFLFYKGWLKNIFKLRITRGVKTLFSDAHKLTGIWALVFTVLIALTGIFYFAEEIIQETDNGQLLLPEEPPKIEKAERVAFGENPTFLQLDEYVDKAKQAFPSLRVAGIRLPHNPDDYVYVDGQAGNPISRDRANKVYLHPFTGEVVHIQRSSELDTAEFITDIADPLHFGYFWGLSTKIIWFIFGLALSFAILSGTYLWYIRGAQKMERKLKRMASREQVARTKVVTAGFMSQYLTLSRGAIISTAIILLYLLTTAIGVIREGIPAYGSLPEERLVKIETLNLDPWSVDLICEYPCTMEKGTKLVASFNSPGLPNYESLSLTAISSATENLSLPFSGSAKQPSLVLDNKIEQIGPEMLAISIKNLKGSLVRDSLAMPAFKKAQTKVQAQFSNFPKRIAPEVPSGIYAYILSWALLTVLVIVAWTYFLVKTTNKQQKLLKAGLG
ncbi:PepSY-associated TM helix domain-containing protein [Fodinibius salsisoli]|uniref:PepSY domain-containing protein n=1 Tax=Fodinibius salsisoli TaxID=2820877 RepID=A0ABT3PMY3_9BACT|nr:PepSY-associated TM helix domain-containing protein [Fodinibius salsisoli]MCW9707078.1 PepSY domain-containing protein [Fodinibius salsisoli]